MDPEQVTAVLSCNPQVPEPRAAACAHALLLRCCWLPRLAGQLGPPGTPAGAACTQSCIRCQLYLVALDCRFNGCAAWTPRLTCRCGCIKIGLKVLYELCLLLLNVKLKGMRSAAEGAACVRQLGSRFVVVVCSCGSAVCQQDNGTACCAVPRSMGLN
jgi:hypothetical protein